MEDATVIKAGTLFCLSEGEHARHKYEGHFIALKDISRACLQANVAKAKSQYDKEAEAFLSWFNTPKEQRVTEHVNVSTISTLLASILAEENMAVNVTCVELHVDRYGTFT